MALAAGATLFSVVTALAGFGPTGQLPNLGKGKVWSVAVSPQDPNVLLAGTDNGVYRSGDAGATWKSVALSGVRVWVVGFDIRTPIDAYAGTAGSGISRSADDGVTWADASSGLPGMNVRSMTFSLSQIAVGTNNGVGVSSDGIHWVHGGLNGISVSAIAVVSNSPSLVLIAGTDTGDTSQGYLWTNSGNTWQVDRGAGLPSQAVVLSVASGPLSAAITHRPIVVNLGGASTSQGTYRSLDSGQTFSPATNLPAVGTTTLTLTTSTFSPLDPNVVYSGADAAGSSGGAMMRSSDSGLTFSDISQGMIANQKNVVSIAVSATTPPTVFAAVDPPTGGALIYKLVDSGAPAPPQLVPEKPGAKIAAAVATAAPTQSTESGSSSHSGSSSSGGGLLGALGTLVHWPVPLLYELIVVLLGVYIYMRWRQHAYVEGPP